MKFECVILPVEQLAHYIEADLACQISTGRANLHRASERSLPKPLPPGKHPGPDVRQCSPPTWSGDHPALVPDG
jgi:hypothetical protein